MSDLPRFRRSLASVRRWRNSTAVEWLTIAMTVCGLSPEQASQSAMAAEMVTASFKVELEVWLKTLQHVTALAGLSASDRTSWRNSIGRHQPSLAPLLGTRHGRHEEGNRV
jgi:hypothetical protein